MASILKVDTIQDQAGNNIISEAANVITIGASGDTITVPAGATVSGFTSAGIDDNATSTAITIDSAENVGIGNTTPSNFNASARQLVVGSGSGDNGITIFAGTSNTSSLFLADGTVGTNGFRGSVNYLHNGDALTLHANATETMRLTNGKVGIGTSSPGRTLHVVGAAGTAQIQSTGTTSALYFADTNSSSIDNQGVHSSGNSIYVSAGGHQRFTVDSNGLVRIKNTSHTNSLITNNHNLVLGNESSGAHGLAILAPTNENSYVSFFDSGNSGSFRGSINYNHNGDYLATYVNGSERMRINSSGDVGINTTSPSQKLHVNGHIVTNGLNFANNTSSPPAGTTIHQPSSNVFAFRTSSVERMRVDHNSGARLFLGTTSDLSHGAADNNRLIISGHSNNGAGSLGFVDTSGNTDATITANDGSLVITADTQQTSANSSLQFRVDNSEKMRLTSGDRLLINSTTNVSSEYLLIKNNYTRSGMTIKSNTNNPHHAIEFHNTNNQVGSINTNGSSTDYNTSSDYRLKENVNYNFDATSRLKQLKPARFNFIADADKTVDGFLAHEVSDIVPEAIHGTKDAVNEDGSIKPQGIDQSKLVPLLVKTIQELEARITTLEANNP